MGFHEEALSAPRPTPKLEDHPSSAVRDCLFNLFAATLHIGGRSSIFEGGKIEKNEMCGACGAYGGGERGVQGFGGET